MVAKIGRSIPTGSAGRVFRLGREAQSLAESKEQESWVEGV